VLAVGSELAIDVVLEFLESAGGDAAEGEELLLGVDIDFDVI
jgi:hypothetical protein